MSSRPELWVSAAALHALLFLTCSVRVARRCIDKARRAAGGPRESVWTYRSLVDIRSPTSGCSRSLSVAHQFRQTHSAKERETTRYLHGSRPRQAHQAFPRRMPDPRAMAAPSSASGSTAAPETALQKLARRPFTVSLVPPSSTTSAPLHSRHLKRVHLAPEILKAVKVCAGDAVVLRRMPDKLEGVEAGLQRLDLGEVRSSPTVPRMLRWLTKSERSHRVMQTMKQDRTAQRSLSELRGPTSPCPARVRPLPSLSCAWD